MESLKLSPYRSWWSLGVWRIIGGILSRALLSFSRYWGPRKRRSLVCSKVLGSGLQWLCVDVWTPCVLLPSTASMWPSVIVGNDAKWLFSWMLLQQLEVALFSTIAGAEVLDASNSFELSLTSEAHQDALSQEFEEYWLPQKMKHVNHMSLNSTITRQKCSRVCGCQGVEEASSLILRSWVSRKRANMAGTWEKAVKIYWRSQSYFFWKCHENLPAKGSYLIQTKTYIR